MACAWTRCGATMTGPWMTMSNRILLPTHVRWVKGGVCIRWIIGALPKSLFWQCASLLLLNTMVSWLLPALLAVPKVVYASSALAFKPPAPCPTCQSAVYGGLNSEIHPAAPGRPHSSCLYLFLSDGTLKNPPVVPGKVFSRFIQIWFENSEHARALGFIPRKS